MTPKFADLLDRLDRLDDTLDAASSRPHRIKGQIEALRHAIERLANLAVATDLELSTLRVARIASTTRQPGLFTAALPDEPNMLHTAWHIRPGYSAAVEALRIDNSGHPCIRITQLFGGTRLSQEFSAEMARALAAELLAGAEAIDAVMVKRGAA